MAFMMIKVLITETGNASPVITVLRQLFRKMKTMNTVKQTTQEKRYLHILNGVTYEYRVIGH